MASWSRFSLTGLKRLLITSSPLFAVAAVGSTGVVALVVGDSVRNNWVHDQQLISINGRPEGGASNNNNNNFFSNYIGGGGGGGGRNGGGDAGGRGRGGGGEFCRLLRYTNNNTNNNNKNSSNKTTAPSSSSTSTSSSNSLPPKHNNNKITAVIFDFDGVIVDSETLFYAANKEACKQFGVTYSLDLKQAQMGRNLHDAVDCILTRTGLAERKVTAEKYLAVYDEEVEKLLPKIELMPGARRLIEHLQRSGVQTAICTSSSSKEFAKKIHKCHDLVNKMNTVVTAGDDSEVEVGKPGPDPYLVTMRRMKPKPRDASRVLVFEDSTNGVKSALAAGCTVIWVPQLELMPAGVYTALGIERKFQQHAGYAETIDSLEEFEPGEYGLPVYPTTTTMKGSGAKM